MRDLFTERLLLMKIFLLLCFVGTNALATPYPNPMELLPIPLHKTSKSAPVRSRILESIKVLRIQVDWKREGETYELKKIVTENSGTKALLNKAIYPDHYGSYLAELSVDGISYFDSIGMGKEYRVLTRSLSFRFPLITKVSKLKVWAENPETGVQELVLEETIEPKLATELPKIKIETRMLRDSTSAKPLVFTIYADAYSESRKERFFEKAKKVVSVLEKSNFPGQENFRILAVFAPSKSKLGNARDFGDTPVSRDTFLGLYFPHWNKVARWYNIVYPTNESQLRAGLGQAPYDYPFVLMDDNEYWGVGNYRMFTAVPAEAQEFDYLLLHELGHFLGLNEEYEEEGPTELEFAPGIVEPWSPNMTFHPHRGELKWEHLVSLETPLPTPYSMAGNVVGAYQGGYAGSEPRGKNHKPVKTCTMGNGGGFCPVCIEGISKQITKDSGTQN